MKNNLNSKKWLLNHKFYSCSQMRLFSNTSLGDILKPRSLPTFGTIRTIELEGLKNMFQLFCSEWLSAYPPLLNRSNTPRVLAGLLLHFHLLFVVQTSGFLKYIVLNSVQIRHTTYQKAIFEALTPLVRTSFSSRLEGSTNSDAYASEIVAYMLSLKERKQFDSVMSTLVLDFSCGRREMDEAFSLYCRAVDTFKAESGDDFYEQLVVVNNLSTNMLINSASRYTKLQACTDTYSTAYTERLGLFKFRNYEDNSYAVQESGWDSHTSETKKNLYLIIFKLLRPQVLASYESQMTQSHLIGGCNTIPSDVILDLEQISLREALTSMFSLRQGSENPDVNTYTNDSSTEGIPASDTSTASSTRGRAKSGMLVPQNSHNQTRQYSNSRRTDILYFEKLVIPGLIRYIYR